MCDFEGVVLFFDVLIWSGCFVKLIFFGKEFYFLEWL